MQYFQTEEDLELVLTENMRNTYEMHNHISKHIVGMVLEGTVCLENQYGKATYQNNDIFFIPIGQVHALYISDKTTKVLSICIGTNLIQKYPRKETLDALLKYLNELVKQEIIKSNQWRILKKALSVILVEMYSELKVNTNNSTSKEDISQIKALIIRKPEQELDIDYLSKQVHLSKYYMIRKFKSHVGLTPHRFLIQNRIRKAQHLLQKGLQAADVAIESGFCDQSHFIKSFKKVAKVAPKEYVQSLKQLEESKLDK
ncbi:MAG: helix-turn-helix domain-containing protein [Lachnospiraceae bacterium]|nr:helix-turn-helix domain-containing protein [Lachnospiraceae bacterium]